MPEQLGQLCSCTDCETHGTALFTGQQYGLLSRASHSTENLKNKLIKTEATMASYTAHVPISLKLNIGWALCLDGPEERPLPTAGTELKLGIPNHGYIVKESRINTAVKQCKNTQEGNHL